MRAVLRGAGGGGPGPLRPPHLLPVLGADAGAVRREVLRGVPGGAGPGEAGTGALAAGGAGPLPWAGAGVWARAGCRGERGGGRGKASGRAGAGAGARSNSWNLLSGAGAGKRPPVRSFPGLSAVCFAPGGATAVQRRREGCWKQNRKKMEFKGNIFLVFKSAGLTLQSWYYVISDDSVILPNS